MSNKIYPKISWHSVRARRQWANPKIRAKMVASHIGRKYSRAGLFSLRRHVKEKLNSPEAIASRNYCINREVDHSAYLTRGKRLKPICPGTPIIRTKVNDYCGVLCESDLGEVECEKPM